MPSADQDDIRDPPRQSALTWLGPSNGYQPLLHGSCTLLTHESGGPIEEFGLRSSVEHVLSLSEKDRQLAQTLYAFPSARVKNLVLPERNARVHRDQVDPTALLFFANSDRSETRDAAQGFARAVLDGLQSPEYRS